MALEPDLPIRAVRTAGPPHAAVAVFARLAGCRGLQLRYQAVEEFASEFLELLSHVTLPVPVRIVGPRRIVGDSRRHCAAVGRRCSRADGLKPGQISLPAVDPDVGQGSAGARGCDESREVIPFRPPVVTATDPTDPPGTASSDVVAASLPRRAVGLIRPAPAHRCLRVGGGGQQQKPAQCHAAGKCAKTFQHCFLPAGSWYAACDCHVVLVEENCEQFGSGTSRSSGRCQGMLPWWAWGEAEGC